MFFLDIEIILLNILLFPMSMFGDVIIIIASLNFFKINLEKEWMF